MELLHDHHKHKCLKCDYVWQHRTTDAQDDKNAHTCPKCHAILPGFWSWYEGEDDAQAVHPDGKVLTYTVKNYGRF